MQEKASVLYRGRFAPSPTGPLHFGSLVAALGSYLEAKRYGGVWLIRIEDLDPPREMPGAADSILNTLENYGFEWDEEVVYQSRRLEQYAEALEKLNTLGLIYPCICPRKDIILRCQSGQFGAIYDGHCSNNNLPLDSHRASLRIKASSNIEFRDGIQGLIWQDLGEEVGDFNLKRRDGLYSYHIGVTVDDYLQGITHVVRGYDLLGATPRHIYLQRCLNYPMPAYSHLPLAIKQDGSKLSKQNLAVPLDSAKPTIALWEALNLVGHSPPKALRKAGLSEIWKWAADNWQIAKVPCASGILSPFL